MHENKYLQTDTKGHYENTSSTTVNTYKFERLQHNIGKCWNARILACAAQDWPLSHLHLHKLQQSKNIEIW